MYFSPTAGLIEKYYFLFYLLWAFLPSRLYWASVSYRRQFEVIQGAIDFHRRRSMFVVALVNPQNFPLFQRFCHQNRAYLEAMKKSLTEKRTSLLKL